MTETKRITILGLGSILLGDEGFGVHFVRRISERYVFPDFVQVVDGGTLGYGLLATVCECDHLIVIDCIKLDDAPGSLYRFTRQEMEQRMPPATSAHEVEFPDVLSMAELMDEAPEVVFLCIVPQQCGQMELAMSPVMNQRLAAMEQLLLKELSLHTVQPLKITHNA